MPLPVTPHYNGIAVAPNGRQGMLWAPDFAGIYSAPGLNPTYILQHYNFVAGGILPIDLSQMRPIRVNLQTVVTPRQAAYSSDSRLAFVTGVRDLDVIGTGTSGVDRARIPVALLHRGGKKRQSGGARHQPGGKGMTCTAWNLSGPWSFSTSPAAGPGSGPATFRQSGASIAGSLQSSVGWSFTGAIHGSTVNLALAASGQIDLSYHGMVSSSGATITGDLGTFTGNAQCIAHSIL